MAVPKYHEFYNAFLESLRDGKTHAYNDCKDFVKKKMDLNCNACKIRYAMRAPNHPRSSTQLSHMDRTAFSRTSVEHSSLSDTQSIFRLSFQP